MAYKGPTIPRICEHCGASFLAQANNVKRGWGRFCSRSCNAASRSGAAANRWTGGRHITSDGYIRIQTPDGRQMFEHRYIMEEHLGRPLASDEHVHHIDHNRQHNTLDNLRLLTKSEHARLHTLVVGWSREYDACIVCGRTDRPHQGHGMCEACHATERYRRGLCYQRKNLRAQ